MRLGLLIPSSNVVLEPLAVRLQAKRPEVSVHVSRLGVIDVQLDATSRAQFEMDAQVAAAKLLCDAKVDQITWGGTSASWLGIAHDEAVRAACDSRDRCCCNHLRAGYQPSAEKARGQAVGDGDTLYR